MDREFQRGEFALVSGMKTSVVSTNSNSQLKINLETPKGFIEGHVSDLLSIAKNGRMGKLTEAIEDNMSLSESVANEIGRYSKIIGGAGYLTDRASLGVVGFSCAFRINRIINKMGALSHV